MDYAGMLCPKGFQAGGIGKGYLFRERYAKGVPFQGKVCERGANF